MNGRGENPLVNNIKDSVYYGCHGEEVTAVEIKNLQRGKNPHNKLVLKTQTKFFKNTRSLHGIQFLLEVQGGEMKFRNFRPTCEKCVIKLCKHAYVRIENSALFAKFLSIECAQPYS